MITIVNDEISLNLNAVVMNEHIENSPAIDENGDQLIYNYDSEIDDASDLPTSLIVTSVDSAVFSSGDRRTQFESLFKKFDQTATFQYFKSFKRVRVNFSNPLHAARARIECHQMKVGDCIINCYFTQLPESPSKDVSTDNFLQPPSPVRQYLISPPCSPPVGWTPCDEAHPAINYDLLAALSHLSPGETHELHPPSESHPGIVVHVCGDIDEQESTQSRKVKIQQTKRPPLRSPSEGSEDSNDSMCVTPP
ncbi:Calcipressin-3-like protein [Dinothrombium tinctorium]|uniref:Calcipressin-3-like protein n=1 Tax=Dinothrombium tinctorium TaxID=1965070 RepID=A0A3S3PDX6_9ACAR|nr:Calcipressin-3-like protein [Dinothrombium tinctorium]RWS07918.1 Calcipressin-3-like protein [Dinothrombium tinctorium]